MPPRRAPRNSKTSANMENITPLVQTTSLVSQTSGRQRTLSNKQQEINTAQALKNATTQKKAYVAALRTRQADEEIMGFTEDFDGGHRTQDLDDLLPESEDEDRSDPQSVRQENSDQSSSFSSITLSPIAKTTIQNGQTLVHRVIHADSEKAPEPTTEAPTELRRKTLVRRAGAQLPFSPPIMMDQGSRVDRITLTSNTHLPPPQAYYGRGDGTFYQRGTASAQRVMGEELSRVSQAGETPTNAPQAMTYVYPNAHPDLEQFPRSANHGAPSASAGAVNNTSLSVANNSLLGVRKSPPPTPSPSTTIIIKKIKTETTGSRGRIRASDFDGLSKAVLEDAIIDYWAQVCTVEPYPDRLQDRDWAAKVWVNACEERSVRIEFDEDILKLVTQRASQVRGQLKTICRPLVESLYQLDIENGKRKNREKVEDLLDRISFLYKDPKERTGIYRHPIIQAAINKMWFKHKQDDGVVCPEFSAEDHGIPIVTIALVFTAVECCLDEQQTGEHIDVPFSALAYQEKFNAHLKTLSDFNDKTREANIIPRLQKHLLKNARKHAKVTEVSQARATHLDSADFEAAKKEWEDLVLSDDEGVE